MRIVVLGGTGFFGRLVIDGLRRTGGFDVIAAGRRSPPQPAGAPFVRIDLRSADLAARLAGLSPDLIIHCAGPFQAGRYPVVEAALQCGSHYLDLADNRKSVLGVRRFDSRARAAGLVMMTGASSVPALSSAVVAQLAADFTSVRTVDMGITTSERVPGIGTAASVLGQCGHPLSSPPVPAWSRRVLTGWPKPVGVRVMSYCDVPDLALLPERFPDLERVTFCAGVASPLIMWGLRRIAGMRERRWIREPERWAGPLYRAARWLEPFGNGASGMFVQVAGIDPDGRDREACWRLLARNNQGPRVAAQGAVALAGLLVAGRVAPGARPAFMALEVDEYLDQLPVSVEVEHLQGDRGREAAPTSGINPLVGPESVRR